MLDRRESGPIEAGEGVGGEALNPWSAECALGYGRGTGGCGSTPYEVAAVVAQLHACRGRTSRSPPARRSPMPAAGGGPDSAVKAVATEFRPEPAQSSAVTRDWLDGRRGGDYGWATICSITDKSNSALGLTVSAGRSRRYSGSGIESRGTGRRDGRTMDARGSCAR
jgi:hypothetical protein